MSVNEKSTCVRVGNTIRHPLHEPYQCTLVKGRSQRIKAVFISSLVILWRFVRRYQEWGAEYCLSVLLPLFWIMSTPCTHETEGGCCSQYRNGSFGHCGKRNLERLPQRYMIPLQRHKYCNSGDDVVWEYGAWRAEQPPELQSWFARSHTSV